MNRPKIRDFIDECEIPNYTVINLDSLDSVSYQNALNEYINYLEEQLSNFKIKNEVMCQQNELLCKKLMTQIKH
jgi:hypothetical protein